MVSRILKLLNREIHGLHEAAYLLALFAFSSQLLGLVRDRLLAHHFGVGISLDIYYAAFRIPDFIFITVGSLVSVSVLVPFFIEKIDSDKDTARQFINSIFSFFFIFIAASSIVAFFLIPHIVSIIFPGISEPKSVQELIFLTRVLLLSPFFLGLSNFFASITQVYKKFLIYALSPLFYNIGIIGGIIFLAPLYGIKGVVAGVIIGTILHLLLQAISIFKEGMLPVFSWNINFKEIKKIVFLSFPRTLALSATNISLLFLVAFASLLGEGAIAIFTLSFNLQSVPLSIIGVSYSMAAFPTLSRLYNSKETDVFVRQIVTAGRHIIFWSLPITVLFIVLRAQIVRTILGSGQFNWSDTRLTAAAFALFAVSAVAQSLSLLFIRGYYAASKTKKPLFINLFSSALMVVLSFFFIQAYTFFPALQNFFNGLMKVDGLAGSSILMLPLGFACGSIINAFLLLFYFERDFQNISRPLFKTFFHSGSASILMGSAAYVFLNVFDDIFNLSTLPGIFFQGFFSGILGILFWLVILKLLKNEELEIIWNTLQKRIFKTSIISPETRL